MLALLLAVPTTAFASSTTITTCYTDAEDANPGLEIDVKAGTTTFLDDEGDLAKVFDKIAEKYQTSGLTVTANAAGDTALEEAMDCIFEAGYPTLSAVWLNENESAFTIRTHSVGFVDVDGDIIDTASFMGVELDGLDFHSTTTNNCLWVEKSGSVGTNDIYVTTKTGGPTSNTVTCLGAQCEIRCKKTKATPESEVLCECEALGTCSTATSNITPHDTAAVIISG